MKTYKYRIYPTRTQSAAIDKTLEESRCLYNELLALKRDAYKEKKISLSRKDLYKKVKGRNGLYSQVAQNVAYRVDRAFKNFFRRVKNGKKKKGFPRFKKYGVYSSITLPQIVKVEKIGKKTYFPKIGWVNTKYHRKITGTPKTLTIKKSKSGKYFAAICCKNTEDENISAGSREIGLDLGLNHFIATSNGEFFDHPKPMKQARNKRKKLARRFSKTKKSSSNRKRARISLARVDEKIANIRSDFSWKLCKMLIKKYGLFCVEDLNIKGMQSNYYLAASINDVSWGDFLQKLSFKAESAGVKVVKVNPKNTSQKCSNCSRIVKKSLATRMHKCICGLEIDRDINAAQNILTLGKIGQELSESKPVEISSGKLGKQDAVEFTRR
jgi:putative transposase